MPKESKPRRSAPARSAQTIAPSGVPIADPAITAREAMALLGVKKSAFYEWQQKGLTGFPPKRLIGRKAVRYLRSEVIAFRDRGLPR